MRTVKAILIDPFACKVSEVEYDGDDYELMYPLLSHQLHPVHCFTTAQVDVLKDLDALFVDDEGLLGQPVRWFQMAGGYQPFAGKGLIIGANEDGDSASCVTSIDLVRMSVIFLERYSNGPGLVQVTKPLAYWRLLDVETGAELKVGDERTTFRGEHVRITDLQPPHKPESTGKVYVKYVGEETTGGYYPNVIGARFEEVVSS